MGKIPLIRFCVSVWSHWEARFGTTFAVILALVQYAILDIADPKKIPSWTKDFPPFLWLSIGMILLFWACYCAWRDEFQEKLGAQKLIQECLVPNLGLNLGQIQYEYDPSSNLTTLLVPCTITNHGATSHAIGWQAHLRKTSGTESVQAVHFQGEEFRWHLGGGKYLGLQKEKMLPNLTLEAIESNHSKTGRLLFQFSGDIRNELAFNAATLHVGCCDRLSKEVWKQFGPAFPTSEIVTFPDERVFDISDLEIPKLPE